MKWGRQFKNMHHSVVVLQSPTVALLADQILLPGCHVHVKLW